MMGINIASTISRINPPMIMITMGSSKDNIIDLLLSISDFINSETFLNMLVKLPDT
jgi:hypothetical protein